MRLFALSAALGLLGCPGQPPRAPVGMVAIPAGDYAVGSPRVGPLPPPGGGPRVRERRRVHLDAYAIDRTEATRAGYADFLDATGYRLPSVDEPWAADGYSWSSPEDGRKVEPQHPVLLLSWYDAAEYCRWRGARLPTDAEWEVAALGGDGRSWPWGERWDPMALNHGRAEAPFFDDRDGWYRTAPVGSFPSGRSPFGLDDAFGNAWEWTADAWGGGWEDFGAASAGAVTNPHTSGLALYRGARGGSDYFDFEANPDGERNGFLSELRRKTTGVRCAVDMKTR